jgi:hypothetical protein
MFYFYYKILFITKHQNNQITKKQLQSKILWKMFTFGMF